MRSIFNLLKTGLQIKSKESIFILIRFKVKLFLLFVDKAIGSYFFTHETTIEKLKHIYFLQNYLRSEPSVLLAKQPAVIDF